MGLTQERLKELLTYSPKTGLFYWAKKTCRKVVVGSVAGCLCKTYGYTLIGIDGRLYRANRLAFLYMTGEFPIDRVDHKNQIRSDDRWGNLRVATHPQNLANSGPPRHNTSGVKGVSWDRGLGRWVAAITSNSRKRRLGSFDRKEDAGAAYRAAAIEIYGDFVPAQ